MLHYIGIYFAVAICTKVFLSIVYDDSDDLMDTMLAAVWPATLIYMGFAWSIKTVFNFIYKYVDDMELWWRTYLAIKKIKKECEFDFEGKLIDTEKNWKMARDIIHRFYFGRCYSACPLRRDGIICSAYKYHWQTESLSMKVLME